MAIEDRVNTRLSKLIEEGDQLSVGGGEFGLCRDQKHVQDCVGWIAAADHVVRLICPSSSNAYRSRTQQIVEGSGKSDATMNHRVGELTALLGRLAADVEDGLLASVANQARAQTFDDFLDHAEAYLKDKRKNEAAAIGGIVFEDTVRRICRDNEIAEAGSKLDALITDLVKREVITEIKAKRARSAANVRTKATHAQWDEFDEGDVRATILFTRELLAEHLGA